MASDSGNYGDVRIGEIGLEQTDEGIAVLSIKGEHDLNTAPDLRRRFDEMTAQKTPVVVDLSKATFVDSSILGVILESRRHAGDAGLGFSVLQDGGADAVTRVLEITGLRGELPVHASRDEALAEAGGSTEKAS